MPLHDKIPVWKMVREAVEALGGKTTNVAVRDWIFLVVELKVARGSDTACGQIMRYTGWVKRHIANGKPVRGLIIAQHISERIRYAIADIPGITAREYNLSITLKYAPPVNP